MSATAPVANAEVNSIQLPVQRILGLLRKNGTIALADQAVASAANFLTGIIIARSCAQTEFGLYMLGFSVVLVAMDIQTALLATPYMIHSPRLQADALRRYSGATFIQQLVLSGSFAAGLMIASVVLRVRGTGSAQLARVLAALGCVIMLVALRDFIRRVCFAQLRMSVALLLDTCVAVIQVGGLMLIAWTGRLTATRSYWIIGLACAVAVLVWFGRNRKSLDIVLPDVLGTANDNWQLGKWILVSGALWTLTMNAYPWILNAFRGTTATAVWGACLGVTASSNPLLQGVLNYLGPKIACSYAGGGHDGLRKALAKCNAIMAALLLPISAVLVLGGGFFVQVLYGHKYAGNGTVVAVLALGMATNAAAFSYSRALFALDRADLDVAINVAIMVLTIACGVPLAKWLGPLGAAYTLTALNTGGAAFRVIAFRVTATRQRALVGEAILSGEEGT